MYIIYYEKINFLTVFFFSLFVSSTTTYKYRQQVYVHYFFFSLLIYGLLFEVTFIQNIFADLYSNYCTNNRNKCCVSVFYFFLIHQPNVKCWIMFSCRKFNVGIYETCFFFFLVFISAMWNEIQNVLYRHRRGCNYFKNFLDTKWKTADKFIRNKKIRTFLEIWFFLEMWLFLLILIFW